MPRSTRPAYCAKKLLAVVAVAIGGKEASHKSAKRRYKAPFFPFQIWPRIIPIFTLVQVSAFAYHTYHTAARALLHAQGTIHSCRARS